MYKYRYKRYIEMYRLISETKYLQGNLRDIYLHTNYDFCIDSCINIATQIK